MTNPLTIASLCCEEQINPLGVDIDRPRLSWKYKPTSKRGLTQSAFQVLAASRPDLLNQESADLWNSGRIQSSTTVAIEYSGKPLASAQRAYWTVRIWDNHGELGHSPQPGWWESGLLAPADWRASWIAALTPTGLRIAAAHFRKTFQCDRSIRLARLYTSAQGIYVGFLNGHRIGQDHFRPGWTDYAKHIQYQTYDVTSLLKHGANAIGFILGDGWFCGELGWKGERNHYGAIPSLLAQLEIQYDNGSTHIITDATWKTAAGPIISSDFLMGEMYDARRQLDGWSTPEFDDSSWGNAKIDSSPKGQLVAQVGPAVRNLLELQPKSVAPGNGGVYIFDLGQNMVGWARLRIQGAAGSTIILRFAEMLNPDGSLYTDNLRRARAVDQYTLRGGGEEVYEPTFTFHGFRFVEISGFPGVPTRDAITGIVLGSDLPITGKFECSNPLVNQLQSNILWSQRGNFLEVPTDCPQRDERLGWMADAQIFLRTACFNMDCQAFINKWMRDVLDAQSPEGGFPDVAPRVVDLPNGAPAWGDAGVIVPWIIYLVYGDRRILEASFEGMARWIEYIHQANPELIWTHNLNGNFGDWLSIEADTPKELLATAYFAHSAALLAQTARILNRPLEANRYKTLHERIKTAFIRMFVSADGEVSGATQTAYVLALRFDLLPADLRAAVERRLVADIQRKNNHLSTGFIGVGHLLIALAEAGRLDVAYRLLLNETFPSWGYSIRHGATTIWERWNGWTKENGFFDPSMNSFNHYSLGSVGEWIYQYIAGIRLDPDKPGYEHIILHPQPGAGLTHATASLNSPRGLIESSWQLKEGSFRWRVTIPPSATATAFVPTSDSQDVQENGSPLTDAQGVKILERRENRISIELMPGSYDFASPLLLSNEIGRVGI